MVRQRDVASGVKRKLLQTGIAMRASGDSIRVVHPLFLAEDGGSIPTSPLQLHICKISTGLASTLNKLWHSRLPIITNPQGGICFGAEAFGIWYASAIWTHPVARELSGLDFLELRRFAIAPDAPKFTASRMLRIMKKEIAKRFPNVTTLISYQDEDVHAGTIYKAAGWRATHRTQAMRKWKWTCPSRGRNIPQAPGRKTRWETKLSHSQ